MDPIDPLDGLHYRLKALTGPIKKILALSGTPALSLGVLYNDHVIQTSHFGTIDESGNSPNDETIYRIASFTKVMTATAVARLVHEGLLNWNTPIREYLPEFAIRTDECGQTVTLKHLLSNSSGLAVADHTWGQQHGLILIPKDDLLRTSTYVEQVQPVGKRFIYSAWNWGLATDIVEKVTGMSLGEYMQKEIWGPLRMTRTTHDRTEGLENVASGHGVRTDGTPVKLEFQNLNNREGLAGGYAGKSTIADLMRFYRGLVTAYNDQMIRGEDSTPGNPFVQLRTIFTPHVRVGPSEYCLGLFKTSLPGALSVGNINSTHLGKNLPITGEKIAADSLDVWYHPGNIPGFLTSSFLIPSMKTAVIVLSNAMGLFDPTDYVAQLLIGTLLGEKCSAKFIKASETTRKLALQAWPRMKSQLDKDKAPSILPSFPLTHYEGRYWNNARNLCLTISRRGENGLLMRAQDTENRYHLEPYNGDTFYWPPDRDMELCSLAMMPEPRPEYHKIRFVIESGVISSLVWHHDGSGTPDLFQRETKSSIAESSKL